MWLERAIKWLLPREEHFFELLTQLARSASDAGSLLVECVTDQDAASRERTIAKIKEVERAADLAIAEVYKELNRTFVTPIDRSDIYKLGSELEGITDEVYSTALEIRLHAIDELPSGSSELAKLIQSATQEILKAVTRIQSKHGHLEIRRHCKTIKSFEDEGDNVFRTQIAEMFKSESNAIKLLKNKEFLEGLESTLDLCDDVGNVLSTIVIKNS
jgi:predicted phosphate transport protein (TIGR00153 family)